MTLFDSSAAIYECLKKNKSVALQCRRNGKQSARKCVSSRSRVAAGALVLWEKTLLIDNRINDSNDVNDPNEIPRDAGDTRLLLSCVLARLRRREEEKLSERDIRNKIHARFLRRKAVLLKRNQSRLPSYRAKYLPESDTLSFLK